VIKVFVFFLVTLNFFRCGNSPIVYHLILKKPITRAKSYTVYLDKKLLIKLTQLTHANLDDFAEKLELYTTQKYYRLPELNYYLFEIKNLGDRTLKINLFRSHFVDELKKSYNTIKVKYYEKIYSSPAYHRYDFDFMYSGYILDSKKLNSKKFYKRKYLPNNKVPIKVNETLSQIIPFMAFSQGSHEYTLHLPKINKKIISQEFYFKSTRLD